MIQTIPAQVRLRKIYWGLALGYRVLRLDRTEFSPFTPQGVIEVAPGVYSVVGGIMAPSEGGALIWGEVDRDLLEWPIDPAAPVPADHSREIAALTEAIRALASRQDPPQLTLPDSYKLDKASLSLIDERVRATISGAKFGQLQEIIDSLMVLRESNDQEQAAALMALQNAVSALANAVEKTPRVIAEQLTSRLDRLEIEATKPDPTEEIRRAFAELMDTASLAEWIDAQVQQLVEAGLSPLDAQNNVQWALERRPLGADMALWTPPADALQTSLGAEDIADTRAYHYETSPEWAQQMLDATEEA